MGKIRLRSAPERTEIILDKYRSKDGSYDVLVPGSGGKDSMYVSHVLEEKYGMHPLTVTRPLICIPISAGRTLIMVAQT